MRSSCVLPFLSPSVLLRYSLRFSMGHSSRETCLEITMSRGKCPGRSCFAPKTKLNLHESSDFNRFLSSTSRRDRSLALRADAKANSIANRHVNFALVRSSGFPHVRNITNTDETLQIGFTFRAGGRAK